MNELKTQVSEILKNTPVGETVQNDEVLRSVLLMHPRYCKYDVLPFTVSTDNLYKNKQFLFKTKNLKFISFSLTACFNTKESCDKFKLNKAFRNSIKEQIRENKSMRYYVGIRCPINETIMEWRECHVDHDFEILPFSKIINDFVIMNPNLDYSVSCNKFYQFADSNTTHLFQEYHLSCAKLRLISKSANLKANKSRFS